MTREEAKSIAQGLITDFKCESDTMVEFCNAVIEALDQEPCGDCISRENTLKAMIEQLGIRNVDYLLPAEATLYKVVKRMLPVTPQQKIGHWIKHDTGHSIYYDCSLCGCLAPCIETADSFVWKLSKYCPDCGARMQEGGR